MECKSPAFTNGGSIPQKHTGFGEDISPELILNDIPNGTVSLAVIMDDLDVPFCRSFVHWIIWNVPPVTSIPQGIPSGGSVDEPVRAVQGNAWGKHVYRGPKQPPFIRKAHRYRFSVYALDTMLDISADSNRNKLVKAMSGHVIGKAELIGIYDPEK